MSAATPEEGAAPRQVTARIAIIMNARGQWEAVGWSDAEPEQLLATVHEAFSEHADFDEHTTIRWIDVPISVPTPESGDARVAPWTEEERRSRS